MTTRAVIPERPVVNVVIRMASDAGTVGRPVFFAGNVAIRAGHAQVCRQKRKVTEVVIEDAAVHRHYVGTSPFVVGMANDTLALPGRIEQAMEASTFGPVVPDILMAFDAKSRLRQIGLAVMTGSTLPFNLRVPLDYPPGHDQFLETGHLSLNINAE